MIASSPVTSGFPVAQMMRYLPLSWRSMIRMLRNIPLGMGLREALRVQRRSQHRPQPDGQVSPSSSDSPTSSSAGTAMPPPGERLEYSHIPPGPRRSGAASAPGDGPAPTSSSAESSSGPDSPSPRRMAVDGRQFVRLECFREHDGDDTSRSRFNVTCISISTNANICLSQIHSAYV